jgi:hypothetical protein
MLVQVQVLDNIKEQQQRLSGVYIDMQAHFLKKGLDLEQIAEIKKGFKGTDSAVTTSPGWMSIRPREYCTGDYPGGPLPAAAVRLLVLPLGRAHKLSSTGDLLPSLIPQLVLRCCPHSWQTATCLGRIRVCACMRVRVTLNAW